MARQMVVSLAVIALAAVVGANVYNSVVDAASWGSNVPQSLRTAQQYYAAANPGTFFRVASPITQVLAVLTLVVCWRVPGARTFAAVALGASILGDVMTFGYFYPRNAIIMGDLQDVDAAARAVREWAAMNHVRSAVVLAAVVAELTVLTRVVQHATR